MRGERERRGREKGIRIYKKKKMAFGFGMDKKVKKRKRSFLRK